MYVTLLEYYYGVLGSLEYSLFSLEYYQRTRIILPERVLYGAWTQNLPLDSAHPCGTPDAPGMAAFNDDRGGPGPSRPDYLTHDRWGADLEDDGPLVGLAGPFLALAGLEAIDHDADR